MKFVIVWEGNSKLRGRNFPPPLKALKKHWVWLVRD